MWERGRKVAPRQLDCTALEVDRNALQGNMGLVLVLLELSQNWILVVGNSSHPTKCSL